MKKKFLFSIVFTLSILNAIFFTGPVFSEVKTATITNFSYENIERDWFEINVDASYCLKNSALFAEVTNKITGKTETVEIPRVFYDYETLDASFAGAINCNKEDAVVVLKLKNYEDEELVRLEEEKSLIAEMIERKNIEDKLNADNEQFMEESSYFDRDRKNKEKELAQSADETVLAVVILLPMLFGQVSVSSDKEQN
ncbi:MAG TPA: hypothetical protein PKY81_08015 [bacterium]|nr:hypothetical protein [bacterium]HPN30888.1 hypothetical protein [bacterium]